MPFPVRLPPPSTTAAAAAAAATVEAVLAAVALRRYLSTSRNHPPAGLSMSAAAALVAYDKSAQEQELLASAAGSVALGEGEPVGEVTVSLAYEGAGFDATAYMSALRARRFGRWMLWTPRIGSTQDLIAWNFAKLPVGVVCVVDVQFKGRVLTAALRSETWTSAPALYFHLRRLPETIKEMINCD